MPQRASLTTPPRVASLVSDTAVRRVPPSRPRHPRDETVRQLQVRLLEDQGLMRPGFMTLRALYDSGFVVDFEWTFSSAAAGRMLGRSAVDLYGKRLHDVLRDQSGHDAIFDQYRRVVIVGAAGATLQMHFAQSGTDSIRHAAVRVAEGVAVTLINVSAMQRAAALEQELQARRPAGDARGA